MYIFDIDGTLLDTIDSIAYNMNVTLEHFLLEKIPKNTVRKFVGNGPKNLVDKCTEYLGIFDQELRKDILNYYNEYYDNNPSYLTKAYDGILNQLDILRKRGELIAAFSNKPDSTSKKVLTEVIGGKYFDMILGYQEGIERKPSPEGIMIISQRFNVKMTDVIFFGDSEVDIKCGKNAGVFTVACSWGFRDRDFLLENKPDLIIDNPNEISLIRRV